MPLLETGLVAGAALAGEGLNMAMQGSMNRKTQKFAREMYQIQKQDNEKFWHMQNDYNSPEAQMARLESAGLNPNMVYGHGNAIQTAGDIKSPNAPNWSPNAPRVNLGGAVGGAVNTYFDARIKDQQVDNMREQNNLLANQSLEILARIANLNQSTSRSKFDLALAEELRNNTTEFAKENLRKITADRQIADAKATFAETREAKENEQIQSAIQNLDRDYQKKGIEMENLRQDIVLKDLDIQLKKLGINPQDPAVMRILGRILNKTLKL